MEIDDLKEGHYVKHAITGLTVCICRVNTMDNLVEIYFPSSDKNKPDKEYQWVSFKDLEFNSKN
jgi:hypothetical protein